LSLGVAAASGTAAAFAARNGLVGRIDTSRLSGRLTRGIGRHYLFDTTGMKPYPTARQGLAALEGVRDLVRAPEIDAAGVDRIVVGLPKLQQAIVDRRGFPRSRFESIVGLRYQIALALVAPERLLDVRRTPPFENGALRRLMARIRIERARELERHYPRRWPARVEIRARGARHRLVVLHPRGDARNPLGWQDLALKLRTIAGPAVGEGTVERVVNEWREAGRDGPVPELP
jgi:2-methylcitrate dehydratase PrpD